MKLLSFFTFLFVLSLLSYAQEPGEIVNTIKGKIINASTNEPVSYTNIGLEGTFFGTASNEEGNFELKIPQEMVSKNIYFSAVGFKNKQFPVSSLFDKEFNVIKIEPQSYGIEDVDIEAQNKVLIRILRMASENIPYNFIRGPINLTGEYEYIKKDVKDTIRKTAEILIFDRNGYKNPSKQDAYRSLNYSVKMVPSDDYSFSTGTSNMDELLEFDWARTASSVLNTSITNGFKLKLEKEETINNRNYWVISFKEENPTLAGSGDYYATAFEGTISINKEDYSVLKIDGKVESEKNNRQGKSLAIGSSNQNFYTDVKYDFLILYRNLKPELIELNKAYKSEGKEITENSSFRINQVNTTDLKEISTRQYFTGK